MKDKIDKYFQNLDFDIRKTGNARFIDQKVTPDILTIISDCVIEFLEQTGKTEFTSKDIWNFQYSNENIKDIFNKPDVFDKKAQNEYDKLFQQPLKALAYANILIKEKKGRQIAFQTKNREILDFIAIRERNSLLFLQTYLEKVLQNSGIWNIFENFFNLQTKDSFNSLKSDYEKFIIKYTPINGETEVRRIFTKVLNPLAFKYKKLGTRKGNISKTPISLDELFYNRTNWRDTIKSKNETREEYKSRAKNKVETYQKYSLQKAKKLIKKYHSPNSEVQDKFSNGEATQIHHIFIKSDYSNIDSYLENLILLTATQHYTKAHPNNNTRIIDKEYQEICLLAKLDSIEEFPNLYSIDDFIFVLETGLNSKFDKYNIKFQIQSNY